MKKIRMAVTGMILLAGVYLLCGWKLCVRAEDTTVKVVLDAGHDSSHAGAGRGSLHEEYITLGIVLACEQELEKYEGVDMALTRSSMSCPTPGSSAARCNRNRPKYAAAQNADVFISFHVDATGSTTTSARGAMVMYTGYSHFREDMRSLSNKILKQLGKLGIHNRGTIINNDDHNCGKYDDGTWKDDIAVMRGSVERGFPAILIEHGFINNIVDSVHFQTEENIREVGIADARGIADFYGLTKVSELPRPNILNIQSVGSSKVKLTWKKVEEADSYSVSRSTSKYGTYEEIAKDLKTCNYTDSSLKGGKWYYYKIRAVKGEDSNECSPLGTKLLGIPNAKILNQDDSGVTIGWNRISNASGYRIQRSATQTKGYTTIKTISNGKVTSFCDDTAGKGSYYYRIAAYKMVSGTAYYGNYCKPIEAIAPPLELETVIMDTVDCNRIEWTQRTDAIGYTIWRSTQEDGVYEQIAEVDATIFFYEDRDLQPDIQYFYKVKELMEVEE
ncbi:MAG: N-acetylmuramoyl-L-alanine amidase [Lachnospiraceae bacterium]